MASTFNKILRASISIFCALFFCPRFVLFFSSIHSLFHSSFLLPNLIFLHLHLHLHHHLLHLHQLPILPCQCAVAHNNNNVKCVPCRPSFPSPFPRLLRSFELHTRRAPNCVNWIINPGGLGAVFRALPPFLPFLPLCHGTFAPSAAPFPNVERGRRSREEGEEAGSPGGRSRRSREEGEKPRGCRRSREEAEEAERKKQKPRPFGNRKLLPAGSRRSAKGIDDDDDLPRRQRTEAGQKAAGTRRKDVAKTLLNSQTTKPHSFNCWDILGNVLCTQIFVFLTLISLFSIWLLWWEFILIIYDFFIRRKFWIIF